MTELVAAFLAVNGSLSFLTDVYGFLNPAVVILLKDEKLFSYLLIFSVKTVSVLRQGNTQDILHSIMALLMPTIK